MRPTEQVSVLGKGLASFAAVILVQLAIMTVGQNYRCFYRGPELAAAVFWIWSGAAAALAESLLLRAATVRAGYLLGAPAS
jgi:hypothetical protein